MPGYYNELSTTRCSSPSAATVVHSAPWSVGEQGDRQVSHGCVNLAPGYAAWFTRFDAGGSISRGGQPVAGPGVVRWTIYFLAAQAARRQRYRGRGAWVSRGGQPARRRSIHRALTLGIRWPLARRGGTGL